MKRRLRIWLREYFSFTTSERNGILVLAGILFLFIGIRVWLANRPQPVLQQDLAWMDSVRLLFSTVSEKTDTIQYIENATRSYTDYFDPNTASYATLIHAGFFPNIASNIIAYRNKGGQFRQPEDLLKIYRMSPKFFNRIRDRVRIAEKTVADQSFPIPSPVKQAIIAVELNSADSIDLLPLPGIGPYFAGKIVAYRNALGGYYSPDQLLEIWNFRPGLLDTLMPHLFVDTSLLTKININTAGEQELYNHPYIRKKAKAVINFRQTHQGIHPGNYESMLTFTGDDRKRLWPYLIF